MKQEKHIGYLKQDTGEKHEIGDCSSEYHKARSFSDDFPSSMELTSHGTEDSSPELGSRLSLDKDKYSLDHCIMDKIEHGDCETEHDKDSNFLNKVSTSKDKHEEKELSPKFGALGEEGKTINLSQQDYTSAECRESSSLTEIACDKHEKPIAVGEAKEDVDKDPKVDTAESMNIEGSSNKNGAGSIDAAENPLVGRILVENSVSLDNEHLELPQSIIPRGFDRESSLDSFDKVAVENPSSEVGVKHTNSVRSSMTKSYYGYDGSASSSDGNEDPFPSHFAKPPRRKYKHSVFANSNGLHSLDESRVKDSPKNKSEMRYQEILGSGQHDMLSSRSEMEQEARKSSIFEENRHYAMKYRQNNQDDLTESRSYPHLVGNRIRQDEEEPASRLSFIPRYLPGGQGSRIPSSYQQNVFGDHSGFGSPDRPSSKGPDKKELLRIVYELKEELRRTNISKSRYAAGYSGEDIRAPLYYNYLPPMADLCSDLQYSKHPGRCTQVTDLPQMHKVSRMAFSGDAADYRHQVDYSSFRGCPPQDRHFSAQLPSHMRCCNQVHQMDCSGTSYKASCSASSSPLHFRSSQLSLYGRETKSDEQRPPETEMKRHIREKYYSSKRHLMPVAGGIPIVACNHCSELLQLPADFLLYGRRFHRLRCNACRQVMKFSLESGTHLSPKVSDTMTPPPSMVDERDVPIEQGDWVSAFHSSKCPPAEPLSCSDDYGLSFDRSCSTEGENSLMKPLESNTHRNTLSSRGSSFRPSEDRKMKSRMEEESPKMLRSSNENFGSEGSSSKMSSKWGKSSEIEELQPRSGSPLHRLMGYLSPSEVIRP